MDLLIKERGWRTLLSLDVLDAEVKNNPNLVLIQLLSVYEHDMDINALAIALRGGASPNIYVKFNPIYWKEKYRFVGKRLHLLIFAAHTLFVRRVKNDVALDALMLLISAGAMLEASAVREHKCVIDGPFKNRSNVVVSVAEVISDLYTVDDITSRGRYRSMHLLSKIDLISSSCVDLIERRLNDLLRQRLRRGSVSSCGRDSLYSSAIKCKNRSAIAVISEETASPVPYWLRASIREGGMKEFPIFSQQEKSRIKRALLRLKMDTVNKNSGKNDVSGGDSPISEDIPIANPKMFNRYVTELVGIRAYVDAEGNRWVFPVSIHAELVRTRMNPYTQKPIPDAFINDVRRYKDAYDDVMIDVRSLITVEDVNQLLADDEKLLSNRVEWIKHRYSNVRDPNSIRTILDRAVTIPYDCRHLFNGDEQKEKIDMCKIKTISADPSRLYECQR